MNKEKLREKIYDMSNSYLPLDMFFNDIEHIRVSNYNKELAFSDLEKIADFIIGLESKLAEIKEQLFAMNEKSNKIKKESYCLKQQLAEKDKAHMEAMRNALNDFLTLRAEFGNEKDKIVAQADQDKISFAVEKLEEARKEFAVKLTGCKWEDKMLVGKFCNITNDILDNQIKQLKEKVE